MACRRLFLGTAQNEHLMARHIPTPWYEREADDSTAAGGLPWSRSRGWLVAATINCQ